jgi:hypothetical protein
MKNNSKLGGLNFIIITVITILYILMVTKLAEVISLSYDESDVQVSTYVMIIYIISIMNMAIAHIYLTDPESPNKTANYILASSFNFGGAILLIYTIINYWSYLGEFAKLSLIALSITCIIYYVYKYYDK